MESNTLVNEANKEVIIKRKGNYSGLFVCQTKMWNFLSARSGCGIWGLFCNGKPTKFAQKNEGCYDLHHCHRCGGSFLIPAPGQFPHLGSAFAWQFPPPWQRLPRTIFPPWQRLPRTIFLPWQCLPRTFPLQWQFLPTMFSLDMPMLTLILRNPFTIAVKFVLLWSVTCQVSVSVMCVWVCVCVCAFVHACVCVCVRACMHVCVWNEDV